MAYLEGYNLVVFHYFSASELNISGQIREAGLRWGWVYKRGTTVLLKVF
jgi:hypothetical protein